MLILLVVIYLLVSTQDLTESRAETTIDKQRPIPSYAPPPLPKVRSTKSCTIKYTI